MTRSNRYQKKFAAEEKLDFDDLIERAILSRTVKSKLSRALDKFTMKSLEDIIAGDEQGVVYQQLNKDLFGFYVLTRLTQNRRCSVLRKNSPSSWRCSWRVS